MSVTVERDVGVAMRDGVELATDVYRPADDGSYPVLVQRIPYDKSFAWYVGSLLFNPLNAVERGYVVVVQDTRGRFDSGGEWEPFVNEADDGYDTVEWAAEQPWSDGQVGVYGSSYMGVTAWQAAVANPPHLEAVIAYLTGGNYHDGWTYSGGAFELGFNLHWILGLGGNTLERNQASRAVRNGWRSAYEHPSEAAEHLPIAEIPWVDEAAPYWKTWLDNPAYGDYWEGVDVAAQADRIDVPVLHVTGWFDLFLRGHLDVYEAIAKRGGEAARENQRFVVGPWDHAAYLTGTPSQIGDRRFGPDAAGGVAFMESRSLDWFDRWLKDERTDQPTDGVRYFDLGRRTWEETERWPPASAGQRYYLRSDGDANTRFGDGRLTTDLPADDTPDSYTYDPRDPVPTCGGRTYAPELASSGIQDRSDVERRDDVLVYTSPRLTEPVTIAGPVDAAIYAATSAPDTDFVASLVDVEPDGYCASLADGIVRGRYRDGTGEESFLNPGEVHEFTVDLWAVAHTFEPGHRIRLEITSSNFPRYDRNPNAEVPVAAATEDDMRPATQRVFHDPDRPSHLSLPVVD